MYLFADWVLYIIYMQYIYDLYRVGNVKEEGIAIYIFIVGWKKEKTVYTI